MTGTRLSLPPSLCALRSSSALLTGSAHASLSRAPPLPVRAAFCCHYRTALSLSPHDHAHSLLASPKAGTSPTASRRRGALARDQRRSQSRYRIKVHKSLEDSGGGRQENGRGQVRGRGRECMRVGRDLNRVGVGEETAQQQEVRAQERRVGPVGARQARSDSEGASEWG
jgi:hypothetical protein